MLRLFDTARGGVFPLELRDEGKVSMYVCGPTVYGPPHLGHGRQTLVYDVLRRYLTWCGLDVRHVSNITDVDDNVINKANEEGVAWDEVATHWESVWWEAMEAIDVLRPTVQPHASEYIDGMVELIKDLVARGIAYETDDGVYFDASHVADYGLLARQSIDSLRAGARVETNEDKRAPVDFALWKKAKPGEPDWPSPWGDGRPGWHTECVVMSLDLLGDGFDLHTGGQELAFPHHENERAQAVAEGKVFARHWMHHGWVVVDGVKMSKSLGNFTNLLDLISSSDPRAYRLLVLRAHYRSPLEVTKDTIATAQRNLERYDSFGRRFVGARGGAVDEGALERFRASMDDDLGTPAAMALLDDLVSRANAGDDAVAAATAFSIAEAVGLELRTDTGDVDAGAQQLAAERDDARAARDYARADALRDQLHSMGYEVEDTPSGTVIRER